MNEQEFAELAAGNALNALSPDDQRAFTAALLEHPEWASIVAEDAATAAALAGGVAEVAPPLGARGALMARIARTAQDPLRPDDSALRAESPAWLAAPAPEADDAAALELDAVTPTVEPTPTDVVQTVARRTWMRGVFALAASIVVLVTLGFGAALVGQQLTTPTAVTALQRIDNAPDARTAGVVVDDGQATAHWSESLGEAVLVADGLPALSGGKTYQLWFVRGDKTIDSAGLFTTDRDGEATSLLNGTVRSGDTIAVSVEPAGGSDQPTTTPIITIPTAA